MAAGDVCTNGGGSLRLDRNSHGPGDLRLYGGWLLREGRRSRLALRIGVKLPTGDSDRLLGSGATDFSIGLAGDANDLLNVTALSGFYRISALRPGTPDLLPGRSRRLAGQFSTGLDGRDPPTAHSGRPIHGSTCSDT